MPKQFEKKASRTITIERDGINAEKRTVEVAFSSESPVERWGENEVLSHDKGDFDFSRIKDGDHPLLLGHAEYDPKSQIGVIEEAWVDKDKKGRARVRFGNSPLADEIFKDVQDGIRKLVSVGYDRTGIVESKKAKDGMVTTRYRWMPYHIAIVPVPADTTVGVGRQREGEEVDSPKKSDDDNFLQNLTPEQKNAMFKILRDHKPAEGGGGVTVVDEPTVRANALKTERERIKEISDIGDELIKARPSTLELVRTLVNEAIGTGMAKGDFQMRAFKEVMGAKPVKEVTMEEVGLSKKEQKDYSLLRAVQSILVRDDRSRIPDGLEGDCHKQMVKMDLGIESQGFLVPSDAPVRLGRQDRRSGRFGRDLQANVFGQGGASVATELITPIIELLRNRMQTDRAGVQVWAGLQGNMAIPRQTGAGTAFSVSEIGALTLSTQVLDQIGLTPKRVGAFGNYSKQLLLQSSIDVDTFLRGDLLKVIAMDWDRLIINGQGAASEPMGILNTPGVGSIAFGAAATYAKLVSMETAVATANADIGAMTYMTTPKAKGVLKSAAKLLVGATTVTAVPIWDGGSGESPSDGIVNGYLALATNQVPLDLMIFGVWSQIILGLWGGYDVVVDPYTKAATGQVVITFNTFGDVAIRHAQSLCVSSDSAAQ